MLSDSFVGFAVVIAMQFAVYKQSCDDKTVEKKRAVVYCNGLPFASNYGMIKLLRRSDSFVGFAVVIAMQFAAYKQFCKDTC